MTLKEKVYQHYLQLADDKIATLQKTLADLKESGSNETKSTAGDKHETALAMLQIEQENNRNWLKNAQEQKALLQKINPVAVAPAVGIGSLVKTNHNYLFISVALGKAIVDKENIIAISPSSPLGKIISGLKPPDTAEINGIKYRIEAIL